MNSPTQHQTLEQNQQPISQELIKMNDAGNDTLTQENDTARHNYKKMINAKNNNIIEEIDYLNEKNTALTGNIDALNGNIDALNKEIHSLNERNTALTQENTALTQENTTLTQENATLIRDYKEIKYVYYNQLRIKPWLSDQWQHMLTKARETIAKEEEIIRQQNERNLVEEEQQLLLKLENLRNLRNQRNL